MLALIWQQGIVETICFHAVLCIKQPTSHQYPGNDTGLIFKPFPPCYTRKAANL